MARIVHSYKEMLNSETNLQDDRDKKLSPDEELDNKKEEEVTNKVPSPN